MKADEFAELARIEDAKFRVNKIVLHAEGQTIRGHGSLHVRRDGFDLSLEVAQKYQTPEPKRELWKPVDAWKLSGYIEGDLKFFCHQVSPAGKSASWQFRKKTQYIQKLDFEKIELVPAGLDSLSTVQRNKILKRPTTKKPKYPEVQFNAVLLGCEPVFRNAGTETKVTNDFLGASGGSSLDTFIDRNRQYDFGLIKRGNDTHIHLCSKSGFQSVSVNDDWRRFNALLFSIGFTHGFQPWPYRIEYWRGGRKMADTITAPRKLARTPHAPFDKSIGFLGNLRRKGSRNSVVRLCARFFAKQTSFSEKLSRLLFFFRDAGGSPAHFHIKTLALCSLFEGITSLIFEEYKLEGELRRADPQFNEYLKLRDRLARRLSKLASFNKNLSLQRLVGSLSSAQEFRVKDKFRAACEHFNLNYEANMKRHFEAWDNRRNKFMHGNWDDKDTDFADQALIAGAINILALKLMGYSGQMKFNAFAYDVKDRYEQI